MNTLKTCMYLRIISLLHCEVAPRRGKDLLSLPSTWLSSPRARPSALLQESPFQASDSNLSVQARLLVSCNPHSNVHKTSSAECFMGNSIRYVQNKTYVFLKTCSSFLGKVNVSAPSFQSQTEMNVKIHLAFLVMWAHAKYLNSSKFVFTSKLVRII